MSDEILGQKAKEALRHIRNHVMRFGKMPSMRELMKVMSYKSPRSALLLLGELESAGFLQRKENGGFTVVKDLNSGSTIRTVDVPLVGSVPCGSPLLAEENVEAWFPVSVTLARPGSKYFLLRASGDSMDEAGINDGDLILIKQQPVAENGDRIVALIDDEATVKEYQHQGDIVMLIPRSSNPKHKPIILTHDFQIQGIVITSVPNLII